MNETIWRLWCLLCWFAPVSWWFNRARRSRLARVWIWLNANRYWWHERKEGRA